MARAWMGWLLVAVIAAPAGFLPAANQDDDKGPDGPRPKVRTASGSSTSEDAVELTTLSNRMRALLANGRERRQVQLERLRELDSEKRARQRTVEALEKELESRRQKVQEKKEKQARIEGEIQELEARGKAMVEQVSEYLDRIEQGIEGGIDWSIQDRLADLENARKTLTLSPDNPAPALSIAARLQKEHEAMGRLVERVNRDLQLPDKKVAVEAFHYGLIAVIFATGDGSLLGFSGQGQTLSEGLDTVRDTPEARDGYMKAVEILNRRRTPSLIDVYLPTLPIDSKGE